MVLCFQEEFKLFYTIVPAPSNRQILLMRIDTPPPTKHTNPFHLLCIYWPRKKENLDHSWSPGPPDGSRIYCCVLTLAVTPLGEKEKAGNKLQCTWENEEELLKTSYVALTEKEYSLLVSFQKSICPLILLQDWISGMSSVILSSEM